MHTLYARYLSQVEPLVDGVHGRNFVELALENGEMLYLEFDEKPIGSPPDGWRIHYPYLPTSLRQRIPALPSNHFLYVKAAIEKQPLAIHLGPTYHRAKRIYHVEQRVRTIRVCERSDLKRPRH